MAAADGFLPRQARARPLACFSAAFLLGLIAGQRLDVPALLGAVALAGVVALGLLLRRRPRVAAIALLLAGLLTGMVRMSVEKDAVPTVETRYSVEMTGRVASEPYLNSNGRLIFRFDVESADGAPSDLRLRLYLRGDGEPLSRIEYGQNLRLTGHIWRPDPVTNPYEFDFGEYLNRQGLMGYATAKIEDVTVEGATRDLQSRIIAARRAVSARIDALFPGNAGLMRALVLGDRSMLDEELRASLNRTGTAHLISISGLHVTVLAALLAFALRRIMPRRWANLAAILALIPYGALIGFNAPYVRALIMFALVCCAPVAGLPSDSVTRLAFAMLAYLLIRPMSIGDAGFALSFSASAGILLLNPPLSDLVGLTALKRRKPGKRRLRRIARRLALYFPELLCASLAAQLASLPSVIAFFGVQSLVSLPFNLVCVPLCMAGYVIGLVALILSAALMPLAAILARVPDGLFALLAAVTRFSALIPLSTVRLGRYPLALTLLHWAVVLAASDLSRLRAGLRRFMPFAVLAVAGVASLWVLAWSWPLRVEFLDAGQADCAILRSRGHTYVFDTGDTYTPAADYLNATCLRLDGVVLSHPHQDHAGGLTDILASFRPEAIYVPKGWFDVEAAPAVAEGIELAKSMGVKIVELSSGDFLDLPGGVRVDVYSPPEGELPAEVNDMSLLTLVTCQGQRLLFTGDLSEKGEPEDIPEADILKVAHHGSDKATSARFLAECGPDIAVISVGENSYGHPSPETLDKLARVGAKALLTRDCGAITLTRRRGEWNLSTYLEAPHELE